MTPEAEEARDRLLFHLEHQEGFWFALVVGDDPRPRAQLRETAEAWCREHGREFRLHEPSVYQLAGLAAELSRGAPPGVHWIRTDGSGALIEQWEAAASQLVMAMNERREAYRQRLDGAVILEGRESLKRLTRELAPDIFSIRAFIAEPGIHPDHKIRLAPEWRDPTDSFQAFVSYFSADPEREMERASRLANLPGEGASHAWMRSMTAAGFGFLMTGRAEDARRCAASVMGRTGDAVLHDTDDNIVQEAHREALVLRGLALMELGHYGESLYWCERALTACVDAAAAAGDLLSLGALTMQIIGIYGARGWCMLQQGNLDGAEEALGHQLQMINSIALHDASVMEWQMIVLDARMRLAELKRRRGDLASAEAFLRDSVSVALKNAESSTDPRWQLELVRAYIALGELHQERGDLASAVEAFESARGSAVRLSQEDADFRIQAILWHTFVLLAAALAELGDEQRALVALEQYFSILGDRPSQGNAPTWLKWMAASARSMRVEISLKRGKLDGQEGDLLDVWRIIRDVPVEPDAVGPAIAVMSAHQQVADFLLTRMVESDEAALLLVVRQVIGYLKRVTKLGERVIRTAPDDLRLRVLLATAYSLLAVLFRLQARRRAARRIRRKLRALLRSRRTRPSPPAKP